MGTLSLFTTEQKAVFDQISQNEFLRSNFYFTGGTALSYFYLQHRYSEDFDLFSTKKFDNQTILATIKEWGDKLHFVYESRFAEVVNIFNLKFQNGTRLKVDFGYYPYRLLEKGKEAQGISIDSKLDIAVNKLVAINQRRNVKDFVDLYYLLQEYSLYDLIEGLKVKFRMKTDPWLLASDFSEMENFKTLPKMILPLELEDLKKFFREKAKELAKRAVE